MPSLEEVKAKRKLQQQMMLKALMQPTVINPGDPPVKAFLPAMQAFGSMIADKRMAGQEKEAQENYRKTLADALSPKSEPADLLPPDQAGPVRPERQVPRTTEESAQILLQNPDTADFGMQMFMQDLKQREADKLRTSQLESDREFKRAENEANRQNLRTIAELNIQGRKDVAGSKGGNLSPTAQKELFEADDAVVSSQNAIGLLNQALDLNKEAYFGPTAKLRAQGVSLLPGESKGANASINLDNLMTGQALETLRATFGGMPTEGERKVLLEMQASLDKTPSQREEILKRAINLAQRRIQVNQEKAKSLRGGTYFKESPVPVDPSQPSGGSGRKVIKW